MLSPSIATTEYSLLMPTARKIGMEAMMLRDDFCSRGLIGSSQLMTGASKVPVGYDTILTFIAFVVELTIVTPLQFPNTRRNKAVVSTRITMVINAE